LAELSLERVRRPCPAGLLAAFLSRIRRYALLSSPWAWRTADRASAPQELARISHQGGNAQASKRLLSVERQVAGRISPTQQGALLLRETDERLGLTARLAGCLTDRRDPGRVSHGMLSLLRQRIYQIACGCEDG